MNLDPNPTKIELDLKKSNLSLIQILKMIVQVCPTYTLIKDVILFLIKFL